MFTEVMFTGTALTLVSVTVPEVFCPSVVVFKVGDGPIVRAGWGAVPLAVIPTDRGLPTLSKNTFSVPVNCVTALGVNVTVTLQFDPAPRGDGQLLLVVNTPAGAVPVTVTDVMFTGPALILVSVTVPEVFCPTAVSASVGDGPIVSAGPPVVTPFPLNCICGPKLIVTASCSGPALLGLKKTLKLQDWPKERLALKQPPSVAKKLVVCVFVDIRTLTFPDVLLVTWTGMAADVVPTC